MNTKSLLRVFFPAVASVAITVSLAVSAQAQTESLVLSFSGTGGERSYGNLIFDSTGHLYGTSQYGEIFPLARARVAASSSKRRAPRVRHGRKR